MKKQIQFLLLSTLIVPSTCFLMPMPETHYAYHKGSSHFVGDDFKINSGNFSTLVPWVPDEKEKPFIQSAPVQSGNDAVGFFAIEDGSAMSYLNIDAAFSSRSNSSWSCAVEVYTGNGL